MKPALYKINIRLTEAVYDELVRRALRSDESVRSIAAAIVTRECTKPDGRSDDIQAR